MTKQFSRLTEKEYRSYPLESYSSLKSLLTSPEAFLKAKENPFTGNDFTLLGTAVHNLIQNMGHLNVLESSEKPVGGSEDSIIIPSSFKEKLDAIEANISQEIKDIVLNSQIELPCKGKYKKLEYKGKVDLLNPLFGVGEIKTSSKAIDLKSFRKEAYSRDYDLQAAMYVSMTKSTNHFFIVANTTAPYQVVLYPTSQKFLESGLNKLRIVEQEYGKLYFGYPKNEKEV